MWSWYSNGDGDNIVIKAFAAFGTISSLLPDTEALIDP
jgi:hypothetical protein